VLTLRRALLLINRRSRSGSMDFFAIANRLKGYGISLLEEQFDDPGRVPCAITEHCPRIDLVILAGGDGTMNSAIEALLACKLPLGILPTGTANDLARTLGIPPDLDEACEIIGNGLLHRIDLGWVNDKHFFNVASLGISTKVAHRLSPEVKRRWGQLSYFYALLGVIRQNRPFRAMVKCDGKMVRLRSIQISVGNGRYYGGGLAVAADAAIDDGQLDLYSLRPLSFWQMVRLAPALYEGEHGRSRDKVIFLHGSEMRIETARPLAVDTDGEVTTRTPAHLRVIPGAIAVHVPAAFSRRKYADT
jgi:diacylglycerol kinase (ATP)